MIATFCQKIEQNIGLRAMLSWKSKRLSRDNRCRPSVKLLLLSESQGVNIDCGILSYSIKPLRLVWSDAGCSSLLSTPWGLVNVNRNRIGTDVIGHWWSNYRGNGWLLSLDRQTQLGLPNTLLMRKVTRFFFIQVDLKCLFMIPTDEYCTLSIRGRNRTLHKHTYCKIKTQISTF